MDLSKNSKFFAAYGDIWSLMKKYSEPKKMEDMRNFVKDSRELEQKYPNYQDFVGSTLFQYGRIIEREILENGNKGEGTGEGTAL